MYGALVERWLSGNDRSVQGKSAPLPICLPQIWHEPQQRSQYSDWLWAGRPRGQSSSPNRV
jgi:hypothetical protein